MTSLLTLKQEQDLQYSILDYLKSSGFQSSYQSFSNETGLTLDDQYQGLLQKKWTSIIRLQKKIMQLEETVQVLQSELSSMPFHKKNQEIGLSLPKQPEKLVLKGHQKGITAIAFHPTFTNLATSSDDATIKIWDFETGEFEKTLKGHTKSIQDLCFHSDGNYLVSSSMDLSIKVWDVANNYTCTKTLHGHDHTISSICLLPNSDTLLSVSRDSTMKVWDLTLGYCINTIQVQSDWIRKVICSDDGQFVATCGNDHMITLWNPTKWHTITELRGHDHVIESIVFAPIKSNDYINQLLPNTIQSQKIEYIASASRDKMIKLWNIHSHQCIYTFSGHENWCRDLYFYPDGSKLVSVGDDKTLKVWDLSKGTLELSFQAHSQFVVCVALHPTLPLLVTGSSDKTIKCWLC
ncbi:Lissencephaly-1 [Globomyces pollinis-pini]|nr:Lissencephaly-1 [Globomyces pollinis-pini]